MRRDIPAASTTAAIRIATTILQADAIGQALLCRRIFIATRLSLGYTRAPFRTAYNIRWTLNLTGFILNPRRAGFGNSWMMRRFVTGRRQHLLRSKASQPEFS
jgi:hypothetical protein